MTTVIFVNYPLQQPDSKRPPLEYGLYDSLSRVAWSIALCYIIFACVHNSGGVVNWYLSHPLWQPISRVCYAIYLLHFFVISSILGPMKTPSYFSELNVVCSKKVQRSIDIFLKMKIFSFIFSFMLLLEIFF